jgi:hypothetical protein
MSITDIGNFLENSKSSENFFKYSLVGSYYSEDPEVPDVNFNFEIMVYTKKQFHFHKIGDSK